jgi:Pvc16 N-terminal domain
MSNSRAIAAVTSTLQHLIERGVNAAPNVDPNADPELSGVTVTIMPPDEARPANNATKQINLFLYQVMPSAGYRNLDMPGQVKSGETGPPPLALNLHYLLTAYADDVLQPLSHRLLGRAMSILHDHTVLGRAEIDAALPGSGMGAQFERVRVTHQALAVDEIYKLWSGFQTHYRISAAYEATVVLIESRLSAKTPLPVLTRGRSDPASGRDQGVFSQADLTPPFPTLVSVLAPNQQPSVLPGDLLIMDGHHLDGSAVSVEAKHARLPRARPLTLAPGATATEIKATVPNQPNDFPAGFYTLTAIITRPGETFGRTTNALSFALAPRIESISAVRNLVRDVDEITITLTCAPLVLPEQRATLLLGEHEILAASHAVATNNLTFVAKDDPPGKLAPGPYFVRLRVDGVDSLLIDRTDEKRPKFDESQKVTIP